MSDNYFTSQNPLTDFVKRTIGRTEEYDENLKKQNKSEKSYARDLYRPKITTSPKTDEPDFIDKYGKHLGIAGLASLAGLGVVSAYTIKQRLNKNKQK